jgi:two-component SAPR family response regulator
MDEWKRKKARDIFKLLAVHHRRPLTTDEIVQKIWGDDVAVEACVPTLQNAISAIRTALEPTLKPRQPSAYVSFRDGAYTLDLGNTGSTDIDLFRGLISSAYREDDLLVRRQQLTEATDLYHGDLLPDDVFTPWTDYVRDDLRQMCSDALDALASVCLELGDHAAAKIVMRRAGQFEE